MAMLKTTIKSMLLSLLLSLFSVWNGTAILNPDVYNFSYLTADDGMAQNMVDDIYKDSRGFMWFATWNGLDRFDGYEFVRYSTRSEHNSLSSPFVYCLAEDRFQRLWVGTEEGLDRIDLLSGEVIRLQADDPLAEDPLFASSIHALLCDADGRIWVGSTSGLSIVSLDSEGNIEGIDHLQEGAGIYVESLCQDEEGTIWVGYRGGKIQSVSRLSEKAFQFTEAPKELAALPYADVFALYADGADLWIGTGRGLARYNRVERSYRFYTNHPDDPHSLIQDHVKDIVRDREGNILIATLKGLSIYNSETDNFLQIASDPDRLGGLNNNFVNSLYVEPEGTIWIGTEKGESTRCSENR